MKLPRGATGAALAVTLLLCFLGVARLSASHKAPPAGLTVNPLPGADLDLGRRLLGLYSAHIEAAKRGDEKAYLADEAAAYRGKLSNYLKMDRESPHLHPEGFQIYDARQHDFPTVARLVLVRPAADPKMTEVLCLGFMAADTLDGPEWKRLADASYSRLSDQPLDPELRLPWTRLQQAATGLSK